MNEVEILFKRINKDVHVPLYATEGSSGFDLIIDNFKKYYPYGNQEINPNYHTMVGVRGEDGNYYVPTDNSVIPADIRGAQITSPSFTFTKTATRLDLAPGARCLIGCGFSVAIPKGYELQIRTRSGLALKEGIIILNSPGTIDSDYRGEIGAIIMNVSRDSVVLKVGERIAQAVLQKINIAKLKCVDELPSSDRGESGFGSTGK